MTIQTSVRDISSGLGVASPLIVPTNGGETITVIHRSPTQTDPALVTCVFDTTYVKAVNVVAIDAFIGDYTITCPVPPHASGKVPFYLLDGGPPKNHTLTYYRMLSISSSFIYCHKRKQGISQLHNAAHHLLADS